MAKKVMKRLREEVERKSLKLSISANGKEGKSKIIASCGFLVEGPRQCSKEGVAMADSVETLGVDLALFFLVREKSYFAFLSSRFFFLQSLDSFQKNYMKAGSRSCCERGWCQQGRGEYMHWRWLRKKDLNCGGRGQQQQRAKRVQHHCLHSWKPLALKWKKKSSLLWLPRQRVAQEERARRNVQDADDEDDHDWTEACEGIAKKMLKVFGGHRSHEGQHERIEGMTQVRILCALRGRREMRKANSFFRSSDKERTRSSSLVWRGGRNN